jgi:carbonic anhydrase/acetyltransferase-like protein (isoleucine patch superfamily)
VALLLPFNGVSPRVSPDAFLAPNAVLIGDVAVGVQASVWFGAVLRGDHPEHGIVVGPRTSVQDNCVIHVGDWQPTRIGSDVTVGHGATFESCTIEDRCVIGMNAVILQEAVIGAGSLVAANAVVLEGTRVPPGSLVAGVPAKVRKALEGSSSEFVGRSSAHYVELSRAYLAQGIGGVEPEGEEGYRCEICGGPVLERHCKVLCLNCGYQRDCSDP